LSYMDTGQQRTDTDEPVRKNRTAFAKQAAISLYTLSGMLVIAVLCTTALVWGIFVFVGDIGMTLALLLVIGLVLAVATFPDARRMWALRESHASRSKVLRSLIPAATLMLVGVGLVAAYLVAVLLAISPQQRILVLGLTVFLASFKIYELFKRNKRGQVNPQSDSGS